MLPFGNNIKKTYSPYVVSVVHFAYFIVFGGGWGGGRLRCLLQLSVDEVKANTVKTRV